MTETLDTFLEEIGRKTEDWIAAARVVDKIAAMTTSEKGQGLILDLARQSYSDGLFRGLCDGGHGVDLSAEDAPARKWREYAYAQQAAIRGNDAAFRSFLGAQSAEDAAQIIRAKCGVASRKAIAKGTPAGAAWERLERDYFAHKRGLT